MADTPQTKSVNGSMSEVQFTAPKAGTPAAEALAANAAIKVTKLDKGLAKFRQMKRPKMKSLNIVKKLYKTTKQKKGKRHFSRVIKGKVIDGVNELYTLTAGIMLALRCSIGQMSVSNDSDKIITVEDFSFVQKLNFPAAGGLCGNFRTPPHGLVHTFKFKSYAPKVFRRIRDFFGMSTMEYMLSVCGNYNYLEFISNSKSGQFFFYSHDGKYMIKTQTKEENKFMKRILPHYYKYVTEHPNTLLVRILGMHRVKMYHLRRKVHFVIMSSVFDTREEIHQIYDLKGSLIGRNATPKEKASGGVLKDQDLLDSGKKFLLGSKKGEFIKQLRSDAMFLAELNIMDYSLLVGTHDRNKRIIDPPPGATGSSAGGELADGGTPVTSSLAVAASAAVADNEPEFTGASNLPFRRRASTAGKIQVDPEPEEPVSLDALHIDVDLSIRSGELDGDSGKPSVDSRASNSDKKVGDSSGKYQGPTSASIEEEEEDDGESYDTESEEEDEEEGDEGDSDLELPPGVHMGGDGEFEVNQGEMPFSPSHLPFSPTYNRALPNKLAPVSVPEEASTPKHDSPEVVSPSGVTPVATGSKLGSPNSRPISRSGSFRDMMSSSSSYTTLEAAGVDKLLAREDSQGNIVPQIFRSISGDGLQSQRGRSPDVTGSVSAGTVSRTEGVVSPPTFGMGATKVHPWTARADGGINCRLSDGTRGNDIYYMGVIDILQQYNVSKKMENLLKVWFHIPGILYLFKCLCVISSHLCLSSYAFIIGLVSRQN